MASAREAEVRAAVQRREEASSGAEYARFIAEFGLCQAAARIDLAAIHSRLVGWEIKTAYDSLERLPGQEAVYSRVFDRVWLVADQRHIDKALDLIPGWWGVLEIRESGGTCSLAEVRRSRLNPKVDLESLVKLLWRQEAFEELEQLGLAGGLQRAPKSVLWRTLADAAPHRISATALRSRVRGRLKERRGWRFDEPHKSSGDL